MSCRLLPVLSFSLMILAAVPMPGQTPSRVQPSGDNGLLNSPLVTAVSSRGQVRFTALALAQRMRLEIISQTGEPIYDSGFQPGNLLEWQIKDQYGSDIRDGYYGCFVTVEDLHRQVSYRQGIFQVKDGRAFFTEAERSVAVFAEEQESLMILRPEAPSPFTLVSHDGSEGWVESASGGLSFHAGTLSRDRSAIPQLRLTPEGNFGIGVQEPQAKLDVAGVIKAAEGFQFSDGTILKMESGFPVLVTDTTQGAGGSATSAADRTGSGTTRVLAASGGIGPTLAAVGIPRVLGWEGGPPLYNTFFGLDAGTFTRSSNNSFFGYRAGYTNTTGNDNSFVGYGAGYFNSIGNSNSFFGYYAGYANTEGINNALFGKQAGYSNTTGSNNSFFGTHAGITNQTGSNNSFFGQGAGWSNTTGSYNSFFGQSAGYSNSTGGRNAFFGAAAGNFNTTGSSNSFINDRAGYSNTTGNYNSFIGPQAGFSNTSGSYNAFIGPQAGYSNTTGLWNSFIGDRAGYRNSTGGNNVLIGPMAGFNNTAGSSNAFIGYNAGFSNTTESNNSFIGATATGEVGITNATAIGARAKVAQSNSLVLGSIKGINGATADTNVGIGTTTPASKLTVVGDIESSTGFKIGGSSVLSVPGTSNTLLGVATGQSITTGTNNSFFGYAAGQSNTTGGGNSFFGLAAGTSNTTGDGNSFFAIGAGHLNSTGANNSFFGLNAGYVNTTGCCNSFFGRFSGSLNTIGGANSIFGYDAGLSNTTENANTFLGAFSDGAAGITNATAIGYRTKVTQSNSLVLGSINGVSGATADTSVGIGTTSPSARLHVQNGDILIGSAGQGIILKSPDGTKCVRLTVDDSGSLVARLQACP